MDKIVQGQVVKVECEVIIPADASCEEVEDWLNYSLGRRGALSIDNPLFDFEPTIDGPLLLTERPLLRRYDEISREKQPDGSTIIKRRRVETPCL